MSDNLSNNIDRKLMFVSMSLFSGSQNPNMVIILVCGSHFIIFIIFKMADANLQCPISRQIMVTET